MTFFEVKRQSKDLDLDVLGEKVRRFKEATGVYGKYEMECRGLSMEEI